LRGKVVGVPVTNAAELQQYKGKLKGVIVAFGRPRDMEPPMNPLRTPWNEDVIPIARPKDDKSFEWRAYIRAVREEM
jgi:hypothetical protein